MIYDALERLVTVVRDNFETDLEGLRDEKELTITTSAVVYPGLSADEFADKTLPGIGIYALGGLTQAKFQQLRDTVVTHVLDYFDEGDDVEALDHQVTLAAEALLKSIDRMSEGGTVIGAGEEAGNISVVIQQFRRVDGSRRSGRRALLTFTARDRDQDL